MSGNSGHWRRSGLEADTASLWSALADPTRRRILDLLKDRPRTTGDIASHFEISRIAVMRHLDVLARAELAVSRKRGRERWHYLNTVPLQRIHARWFDPVAAVWASSLLRLRDRVESEAEPMTPGPPTIDIALDVTIAAAPAVVFAALTEDPGGWWGHPFLRPQTTGLTLDRRIGGLLVEQWDDGGAVLAVVTGWGTNRHLELTGPFHLGFAVGTAVFELDAAEGGTLVRFSFHAVGDFDADLKEQFSHGWTELVANRLKALVERGARLGIAPDPPPPRIETKRRTDG